MMGILGIGSPLEDMAIQQAQQEWTTSTATLNSYPTTIITTGGGFFSAGTIEDNHKLPPLTFLDKLRMDIDEWLDGALAI